MEHPAYQSIQSTSDAVTPNTPEQPTKPSNKNLKKWIIMVGIVLVILLTGSAYVLSQQKSQKPETKTIIQPTVAHPSPTTDPTADWKTYTSTKYNFSIKYPPAWKVEEVAESKDINEGWVDFVSDVLVCKPEGDHSGCNVRIKYSPNNFPGTKITVVNDKIIDSAKNPLTTTKEVLGNTTVYRTTDIQAMGDQLTYVVAGENNNFHVFGLNPYPHTSKERSYLKNNFKQMLSTFKFTEPKKTTDISSWKTYSDPKYKISFKYPAVDVVAENTHGDSPYIFGIKYWLINSQNDNTYAGWRFEAWETLEEIEKQFGIKNTDWESIKVNNTTAKYFKRSTNDELVVFEGSPLILAWFSPVGISSDTKKEFELSYKSFQRTY